MIERSLSDLQGSVSKIQVACQSGMPKLPEHFQVLHMANTGRVYTMIVKEIQRKQRRHCHIAIRRLWMYCR